MSLGAISWLPSEPQRKEKKFEYLDSSLSRDGEHGDLDDIDGEIGRDDLAIDGWQESV